MTINVRDAFVPRPGTIFISADYSQLELRIMAHYAKYAMESIAFIVRLEFRVRVQLIVVQNIYLVSLSFLFLIPSDEQLISILNSNGDIFTKMASVWKKKPEEDITFVDRRQTKGICYGILYGVDCS